MRIAKGSGIKQKRKLAKNDAAQLRTNGGHQLAKTEVGKRSLWRCSVCKGWSRSRTRLARTPCSGSKLKKWAASGTAEAVAETGGEHPVQTDGATKPVRKHNLAQSENVMWCMVCGFFAESRAIGLLAHCDGPPVKALGTGGQSCTAEQT